MKVCELVVDGRLFHSTWRLDSKKDAQQVVDNWAKYNKTLIMRDYGVEIHTADPKTDRVLEWNKTKGYSLWE